MTRASARLALSIACPLCWAAPGVACVPVGAEHARYDKWSHRERHDVATAAAIRARCAAVNAEVLAAWGVAP